eukprot:9978255-Ditylum_brightwellii.AAC.2
MIICGHNIYQACANVMKKATSASTAIKESADEKLRITYRMVTIGSCEANTRIYYTTCHGLSNASTLLAAPQTKDKAAECSKPSKSLCNSNFFSSEPGLGGVTCAQLFVGTSSKLTKVFGMNTENEGLDAYEDLIRDNGATLCTKK